MDQNFVDWILSPQVLAYLVTAVIVMITMLLVTKRVIGFFLTLLLLLIALGGGLGIANKGLIESYFLGELDHGSTANKQATEVFKEKINKDYEKIKKDFSSLDKAATEKSPKENPPVTPAKIEKSVEVKKEAETVPPPANVPMIKGPPIKTAAPDEFKAATPDEFKAATPASTTITVPSEEPSIPKKEEPTPPKKPEPDNATPAENAVAKPLDNI